MGKDNDQIHVMAAEMDSMKATIVNLSGQVTSLKKQLEDERGRERESMIPPTLPIAVGNPKTSQENQYSPIERLEDAVDELSDEVLMRTANINGCITNIQNKVSNINVLQISMGELMIKIAKHANAHYQNLKTTAEYIKANPTPKVELTQWQRVGLAAKSWLNKDFLTDFRVVVLIFYLLFASSIAVGYAVMYNKAAKHNAALEYYVEKHLDIPHRK